VTAVTLAAQSGRAELLALLIEHQANIDHLAQGSLTQPVWPAAQNGHAKCVAVLVNAAAEQQKEIVDATNKLCKTPCSIDIEMGHADVVGVLLKAGADARRSTPMFYSVLDPRDGDQSHQVDPGPHLPVHHTLEMAVQSFASKACCGCKAAGPDLALPSAAASTTSEAGDVTKKSLSRRAKCQFAYFCDHDCQKSVWSSHKLACSNLRAGSLLCTSPASASASGDTLQRLKVQAQHKERIRFVNDFGPADNIYPGHPENYIRATHLKWEYDAGPRGHPDWHRYPDSIEAACKSMTSIHRAPNFMYCPSIPENDGRYKATRSATPPSNVASRHITFADMTEREVYTGVSRAVRRDGKHQAPQCQ